MKPTVLYDNHNRPINYLRLAVTDKCNLRCGYCMPENICFAKESDLLSIAEMKRLVSILADLGINKIRLTGGEPFLRKGIIDLMQWLNQNEKIDKIHITSNGTIISKYVSQLQSLGINSVNLSLDTLDENRFKLITKRDGLKTVLQTIKDLLKAKIEVKINMVVMPKVNIEDIIPMVQLAENEPISVRFIEQMPFNGSENLENLVFNYLQIIDKIKTAFPNITALQNEFSSTSYNYKIEGFKGSFGVIPAFSRTICNACNRIRITPKGKLKTCLYDNGVLDLKQLLRNGSSDEDLKNEFLKVFKQRPKDGFEAQQKTERANNVFESMSTIGG